MRILITGGLGFIGSHLAGALAKEGHELVIVDDLSTGQREHAPAGSQVIIDDVAKPGVFAPIISTVDACYHLAAIASVQRSREDWLRCHHVNTGGLVNLFQAISQSGKTLPVVFASSAAMYGDNASLPHTESAVAHPISAYGADKLACEYNGRIAASLHGIPNIGLRFFNVFGPRQDPSSPYSGVISIFARQVLQNQPLILYGEGTQSRDFIYVADVVRALMLAMQPLQAGSLHHGVYNICTGQTITVRQLAETMITLAGSSSTLQHGAPRAGDIQQSQGNPEKAAREIGFSAQADFSDSLRQTLDWLKTLV